MILFVIRHKATQQIMPLARRNRGYSWWNPSSNDSTFKSLSSDIPRFLKSEKQAKKCISMWFANPNGRRSGYQTSSGEWDDIFDYKDDGRKKEDLEVVKVRVKI